MDREIILQVSIWLVAILNPIAVIPYYLLSNSKSDILLAKKDARIMAFSAFLILLIGWFLWLQLLHFFGLEMKYFRIAGGMLIAYNAFRMVTGQLPAGHDETGKKVDDINGRWLIVPLTMPLVAWPWSLAYIIWIIGYGSSYYIPSLLAICIGSVFYFLIIRYSIKIQYIIWIFGITLITRFMGLILLGIGIQVILTN